MEEGDLKSLSPSTTNTEGLSEEEERILLEKEFDDYYEDRVHKSAGPVVFLSKSMAMLPVIWTDDEAESECKTYFNLYTFVVFLAWFGLAVIAALRVCKMDNEITWPCDNATALMGETATSEKRFLSRMTVDSYIGCLFSNCIVAILFGIFNLQYIHLCMVLCKRYRMLNKIMAHITQPFKTSRAEEPSHQMLQKILSYRWESIKKEEASKTFDQIREPSEKDEVQLPDSEIADPVKVDMSKMDIPPALLMKSNDHEISREEETTVILQLDILRGIHSDLHNVGQEINQLLGFQILVHLVTSVVIMVIFGFFTTITALDGKFYWPFLAIVITPMLRVLLIGHWAQVMKDTSMKPFWTMSQMSTLDGSPKLERQVQKLGLQAAQKTARISAAGYFYITRNTITRVFGMSLLFIFLLVKFDRLERSSMMASILPTIIPTTATANSG